MDFLKRKKKESRLCVLHIDDSQWVRIPVSVLLRRHFGMRVLEAGGGEEGLAIAARELPDLIILDVMMPLMDGFDTLVQLKNNEKTQTIPVVMCTARDLAREVNMAVRLGAIGYLTKPIEEEALIRKITEVLTSLGKWGKIEQVGIGRYQVPPDLRTDLVIPDEYSATDRTLKSDEGKKPPMKSPATPARHCTFCQMLLEFIAQYDAWYCHTCRKYPELET